MPFSLFLRSSRRDSLAPGQAVGSESAELAQRHYLQRAPASLLPNSEGVYRWKPSLDKCAVAVLFSIVSSEVLRVKGSPRPTAHSFRQCAF
jgi:hypothetical protein